MEKKGSESFRMVILDFSNMEEPNIQKIAKPRWRGKHYTPSLIESKCYNCGSKDITRKEAEAWTSKWKCNKCNKEHFAIHADFMGGALNEDVYVTNDEQEKWK